MPDTGDYTPLRELAWTDHSTVHEAARAGNASDKTALKIYTPPHPRGPLRQATLHACLTATAAQTTTHARCPQRWAPILASGIDPKNATHWTATPIYTRTLQKVIDARLTLSLPALHALTHSIIDALAALEQHASRPHGALHPSNIYIAGSGPLKKSPIHLTDPAPLTLATNDALTTARAADFHALGSLLVTLIRQREQSGWPIEDGPEWTRLGKHAPAWREFCNHLLDPHPPPETTTLDELRRHFARLGGRGMSTHTKILIAITPIVIATAPFACLRYAPFDTLPEPLQEFAIRLGNLPPDVEQVPPEFAQLCTAWYEWFGSLCAELEQPDIRSRWETDPWLREKILPITTPGPARDALDPRLLTNDNRNLETLGATPPETAKRGLIVRRTKQAAATLATLARELQTWPGPTHLTATAERLAKLGLTTAANDLRPPPPPPLHRTPPRRNRPQPPTPRHRHRRRNRLDQHRQTPLHPRHHHRPHPHRPPRPPTRHPRPNPRRPTHRPTHRRPPPTPKTRHPHPQRLDHPHRPKTLARRKLCLHPHRPRDRRHTRPLG